MKGCRLLKSPVSLRLGKRASQLRKIFRRALHSMGKPQKARPRYESPILAEWLQSSTMKELSRQTGAAKLLIHQEALSAQGAFVDYTYKLSAQVDTSPTPWIETWPAIFHDLHRSAARNMHLAGVAEATIMKIAGWKTANMFRRYDIQDSRDTQRAAEIMEMRPAE
jgi:hypothetical protein